MFNYKANKKDAIKAVNTKLAGASISIHDYDIAVAHTLEAMQKQEYKQFKPRQRVLVYLYRKHNALGIASHWSYTLTDDANYSLIGVYKSDDFRFNYSSIAWHEMTELR